MLFIHSQLLCFTEQLLTIENLIMNKNKINLLSALLFASVSTNAFSEESIITSNGYLLDNDYYSAVEGDVTDNEITPAQSRTINENNIFKKEFKLKFLSKGAYTYNMEVTWNNEHGQKLQHSRNHVGVFRKLEFIIPEGARNVYLTATVNDGFFGNMVLSKSITPATVAEGYADVTEFHIWGSTLWPKWSKID